MRPEFAVGIPLLEIRDLSVAFGKTTVVQQVSFVLNRGETLALMGDSGSGKSVSALSILQLLPYPHAHHPSGSIRLLGEELVGAGPDLLREVRGNKIAMVFQEPIHSLNPLHSIKKQISETLILRGLRGNRLQSRILELLDLVGLQQETQRLNALPHELSGGQRQRVMIAMALANNPDILIADEPTTALDVTTQAQIIELLKALQSRFGMAILFITHDLCIVRKIADRVCVMRSGKIVESGKTTDIFTCPSHFYTRQLLDTELREEAQSKTSRDEIAVNTPEVLMVGDTLNVLFPLRNNLYRWHHVDYIQALDGISISVLDGQTLGIVGESGSGKTTLGLALLRLLSSEGVIRFRGQRIDCLSNKALRPLRKEMQIVFQDPFDSLSPRLSVGKIIEEGLLVHGLAHNYVVRSSRVAQVLEEVGIDPNMKDRYPHELSGGQRQRIAIARALVLQPKLLILDEPTSALDMSVRAQIISLLRELQHRYRMAYVFISHDLRLIHTIAHQIIVLRNGRVVESGPVQQVFENPQHPYTRGLLAAALNLEPIEAISVAHWYENSRR